MPDKAVFLDRDDTLIADPGYINNPDMVTLLDGVAEALVELKTMGYRLIVVSNQSAVARGIVTEQVLDEIHDRLRQVLAEKGAYLDRIYYCPYHPDGIIPKYKKKSDWRKPGPGMLLAAAGDMHLDLDKSWMIGNSVIDVEAGLRAGCKTILIAPPQYTKSTPPLIEPPPDYKAVNMKEAVNIIKRYHRLPVKPPQENIPPPPQTQTLPPQMLQPQTLPQQQQQPPPLETPLPPAPTADKITPETPSQPMIEETPPSDDEPPQPADVQPDAEQQLHSAEDSRQLLKSILEQLRTMHRSEMFDEFSLMRLLAGLLQVIVLACLLIAVYFLTYPAGRDTNSVFIALGFAIVLQLMALTCYIMHGRN